MWFFKNKAIFQSTHPIRSVTYAAVIGANAPDISIHTHCKGCDQKREASKTALPLKSSWLYYTAVTIGGSWRLFLFVLENLITKTYKDNNENTKIERKIFSGSDKAVFDPVFV